MAIRADPGRPPAFAKEHQSHGAPLGVLIRRRARALDVPPRAIPGDVEVRYQVRDRVAGSEPDSKDVRASRPSALFRCRLAKEAAHQRHRVLPTLSRLRDLASSAFCQLIELCFAITVRGPPPRPDPTTLFEAQQRGVERPLVK